jgi:hypothetical protein
MDDIGEPTDLVSDEPGRDMYAGLVIVPPFCKATVDIRWIVPGVAGTSANHSLPYTLLIERQSGSFDQENVTIRAASGTGTKTLSFSGQLDRNILCGSADNWAGCKPQA